MHHFGTDFKLQKTCLISEAHISLHSEQNWTFITSDFFFFGKIS